MLKKALAKFLDSCFNKVFKKKIERYYGLVKYFDFGKVRGVRIIPRPRNVDPRPWIAGSFSFLPYRNLWRGPYPVP